MSGLYDDPKQIDARFKQEGAKAKNLADSMNKLKKQLDEERKAYCQDFKQSLQSYLGFKDVHTPDFAKTIEKYIENLNKLNEVYNTTMNHIDRVAMNALGSQPTNLDNKKKLIKVDWKRIQEVEHERLTTLKLGL
jgi:hypothetical protein